MEPSSLNRDNSGMYGTRIGLASPLHGQMNQNSNIYNGSGHIDKWIDSSTVLAPESESLDGQFESLCSAEAVRSGTAFQVPESLPISRIQSQSSTDYSSSMYHVNASNLSGSAPVLSGFSSPHLDDHFGLEQSPENSFAVPTGPGSQPSLDLDVTFNQAPATTSMEDDFAFTSAAGGNQAAFVSFGHGWSPSCVPSVPSSGAENVQLPWCTVAPGPPSSSSQSSYPDTPSSLPIPEDHLWVEDNAGMHAQLPLRQMQMFPQATYIDGESTIRPNHGAQRTPLPGPEAWTPVELTSPTYGSPVSTFRAPHRSSEVDHVSARKHELYQIKTEKDGYHCVFVDKDGKRCEAKPFRLKCNYDKHLDSHLKPYRCKQPRCTEGEFSSTACLLRHEREAHKMHGHTEILCRYENCDRSVTGNGFPRKWNAQDHMKRVHGWATVEGFGSSDGSSPSSADEEGGEGPNHASGKRRSSNTSGSVSKKNRSRITGKSKGKGKKVANSSSRQAQFTKQEGWAPEHPIVDPYYLHKDPCSSVWPPYEQSPTLAQSLGYMVGIHGT